MMQREDWSVLEDQLGVVFENSGGVSPDEGTIIPMGSGNGDRFIQLMTRAKYRLISYEKEFNETGSYSMPFDLLDTISTALEGYKSDLFKFDFVDLIDRYIDEDVESHCSGRW